MKAKCNNSWSGYFRREVREFKSLSLYRACVAEFIGVFMLVFYGVGATMLNGNQEPVSSVHIAIESGFFIAVIITVLGKVSGGHVNPAVSVGFFVTGQISAIRFVLYSICQTFGAIAGAGIVHLVTPGHIRGGFGVILPGPQVSNEQALVCEIIITFMLLFGIFALVDEGRKEIHGFAPLMVGLLVCVNVFSGWNISGGCMNPVRNLGPAIISNQLDKMWLYWVGDMVGGITGALLYDKMFSTRVCLGSSFEDVIEYDVTADDKELETGKMEKDSKNEVLFVVQNGIDSQYKIDHFVNGVVKTNDRIASNDSTRL